MPGSAAAAFAQGGRLPEVAEQLIIKRFALDQPIGVQFQKYLLGLFQWPPNLGFSYNYYPTPVFDVVMQHLVRTLYLVVAAMLLTVAIGIATGVLAAWKRGSRTDATLLGISLSLWSVPYFWIAMIILWVFGVVLRWFPVISDIDISAFSGNPIEILGTIVSHGTLPILALTIASFASYMLIMRSSMIEVSGQDYLLMLKAKGLTKAAIMRHLVKNSILPVVTQIGLQLGVLVSGALLTEIVFSYPGMGLMIYQAVLNRDYPLLEGAFFVIAITVTVANFLADILYAVIDPRVSYE
jgi:peptide/nickel transport system permease protein